MAELNTAFVHLHNIVYCFVELPSSVAELNAAFDMFDTSQTGLVNHRDVFRAILSDHQVNNEVLIIR